MATRFRKENNPLYPLPPDYESLTAEGKKLARVNACVLQETPEDFVQAWAFFRAYYLAQLEDGAFYQGKVPSPSMHYEAVFDMARYMRNAFAAPRGFAKSTVFGTEIPLVLLCTRPYFGTLLLLAKDAMVERRFDKIMQQLDSNQYILNDFGKLRPTKGDGIWNRHTLRLANGAMLIGCSVDGKMRGERQPLILADDPEYDTESEIGHTAAADKLLQQFEHWLFHVIIPMTREGSSLTWIGTLLSLRSFLCHIVRGNDPRFRFWNRRVWNAEDDGQGHVLWPEMWSEKGLEIRREEIGSEAYSAEYLNKPSTTATRILRLHPDFGQYSVDEEIGSEPLLSPAILRYKEPIKDVDGSFVDKVHEESFGAFVSKMFRVITVDYAPTQTRTSDFSCANVMGFDRTNTLWELDMFHGKVRDSELIDMIWHLAYKWKVRVVGIEAVSIQEHLVERMHGDLGERVSQAGWAPRIVPIKYAYGVSKPMRIAGLEWRFNQFKIRLPEHLRKVPGFRELYFQIENFTMNMALLRHDDALDTLAMQQQIIKPRLKDTPEHTEVRTVWDQLEAGERYYEGTNAPLLDAIPSHELTPELIDQLYWKRRQLGGLSKPSRGGRVIQARF